MILGPFFYKKWKIWYTKMKNTFIKMIIFKNHSYSKFYADSKLKNLLLIKKKNKCNVNKNNDFFFNSDLNALNSIINANANAYTFLN